MRVLKITSMQKDEQGTILVTILTLMIFLTTLLMAVAVLAGSNVARAKGRVLQLQAQYAAESGADTAIATLNSGNTSYTGTTSDTTVLTASLYKATFSTTVATGSTAKERVITSVGKVYTPVTATTPKYTRTIRVTAQRTSTSTASSVVSRNILAIGSAVKNVTAKDIYVNGFITTAKNSTTLTAENITVAGKDTGASNCSMEGPATLAKPTSFTNSGQTKTNITVAYNNCITPPGNTSNTNFNVQANQGSVTTIQSTYIPWSQYMGSSYGNANSCNDWTTGTSPRKIPSVSGSKLTHYPDSGSNTSSSCGTSGDLALGSNQYNITDNVHIRASLCAASACSPTFYNPTSNLYFVFVEGTVNFSSVQTASGSGPIAFVVYGADPSSHTKTCPYGGAVYLGQSGSTTTSAPAAFFMATNGVCLDGTKFGSSPALGGIVGKNLYIATQSGSPFDLSMNASFPVSQIPLDLSWRAVRYQRL